MSAPYGIAELEKLQDHPPILELKAMRAAMSALKRERFPGLLHPYDHAERAARMLWKPQHFAFEAVAPFNGKTYSNHYVPAVWHPILDPMETEVMVTGPGSSSKTYSVAALCLLIFASSAEQTTIMLSSTSGSGAERRTWDAVKSLYEAMDPKYRVGRIIDGDKTITVDRAYELSGGKKKDRGLTSLKNGITIVLLPPGNEGVRAARAVVGIKNRLVMWVIDELPMLELQILKYPVTNLRSANPVFKLVGLGNAQAGRNPHRDACEPVNGWEYHNDHNTEYGGTWRTKRGGVCVFLSGWRSPNVHPDLAGVRYVEEYPFPSLSNPIGIRREATALGHGNWRIGIRTAEAQAQLIGGYRAGGDRDLTVLTARDVPDVCLTQPEWGPRERKAIASLDPSFTGTGDAAVLSFGVMGHEYKTSQHLLHFAGQEELIAEAGANYKRRIAEQVVAKCITAGITPDCFGLDISNDGGTMFQEIARAWKEAGVENYIDIIAISSLGTPSREPVSAEDYRPCDEVYDRLVTEHWMQVRQFVLTGTIRGWDHNAPYAQDFYRRKFYRVGKKTALETKKEMRDGKAGLPGTGKSPDHGDSACYLVAIARRHGMLATRRQQTIDIPAEVFRMGQVKPNYDPIASTQFSTNHLG